MLMEAPDQPQTLKEEVQSLITVFLQQEMGNKITNFNISGLMGALMGIIDKHEGQKPAKE